MSSSRNLIFVLGVDSKLQVWPTGVGFPGKDRVGAGVTIEKEILGKVESSGRWPP